MNTHQVEIPQELFLLRKRGEEFIATTKEVDILKKYFEGYDKYISAYHCTGKKRTPDRWKCIVHWKV